MLDNPVRLVRELKGAPLSIVIVLGLVHQRVTQEYLERTTGYTDKPVSQALSYLAEIGMVNHTSAGWQLLAGMQQLPPAPQELEEGEAIEPVTEDQDPEQDPDLDQEKPAIDGQMLNESEYISDSPIIIITELIKGVSNNNNNKGGSSRNNSDSASPGPPIQPILEPEIDADLLAALDAAGIRGKKRETLSKRQDLAAEDVIGWEEQLRKEMGERYQPGILITMLESKLPAPPSEDKRKLLDRQRYLEWETPWEKK